MTADEQQTARELVALNDVNVDPTGTLTLYLGQALDALERLQCDYAKLAAACDIATPLLERQSVEIERLREELRKQALLWSALGDNVREVDELKSALREACEIASGEWAHDLRDVKRERIAALRKLLDEESANG